MTEWGNFTIKSIKTFFTFAKVVCENCDHVTTIQRALFDVPEESEHELISVHTRSPSLDAEIPRPARIALIEPSVNFHEPEPAGTGRSGKVIWISWNVLLHSHPAQLRRPTTSDA